LRGAQEDSFGEKKSCNCRPPKDRAPWKRGGEKPEEPTKGNSLSRKGKLARRAKKLPISSSQRAGASNEMLLGGESGLSKPLRCTAVGGRFRAWVNRAKGKIKRESMGGIVAQRIAGAGSAGLLAYVVRGERNLKALDLSPTGTSHTETGKAVPQFREGGERNRLDRQDSTGKETVSKQ